MRRACSHAAFKTYLAALITCFHGLQHRYWAAAADKIGCDTGLINGIHDSPFRPVAAIHGRHIHSATQCFELFFIEKGTAIIKAQYDIYLFIKTTILLRQSYKGGTPTPPPISRILSSFSSIG